MGILDDAIKEHLELKRQHGADASELQQLEDEAFGAAERPGEEGQAADPLAEAPTEFMQQPGVEAAEAETEAAAEVEEAPETEAPPEVAEEPEAAAGLEPEPPAEEESPAMEHEAVPEPEAQPPEPEPLAPSGPTTEEREAIAEQPTEMYDVEEELASTEPEAEAEEQLLDEGAAEDEEDFFDEQRLSDELDKALEAPAEAKPAEEAGEEDTGHPEDEAEDVLEETPDFLEEDEDEQLWFEQQPPKDFDFDD